MIRNSKHWQPTAPLQNLQTRAQIIAKIRDFFAKRQVLEVDTPLLCSSTTSDPHIQSFNLEYGFPSQTFYLQTSPEFAMKRLLAAGSGPIYQICKAFRKEEEGRYHNPEFTMLEWYRPGFNHFQLMDEVAELLNHILHCGKPQKYTYAEVFQKFLAVNPFVANIDELQQCAEQQGININGMPQEKDTWLQLLLSHCIEPHLGQTVPEFIYDFPALQAALAKIRSGNPAVAERFEVYIHGIELANGYHELADSKEQTQRFIADNEQRKSTGLTTVPIDEYLINALAHGFPECAGVALGIDRLIMLATKSQHIEDVVSFTIKNA